MTKLGEYLTKRSVNKAIVARKTGLGKQRMGELTLNENAMLRAREVYLTPARVCFNDGYASLSVILRNERVLLRRGIYH